LPENTKKVYKMKNDQKIFWVLGAGVILVALVVAGIWMVSNSIQSAIAPIQRSNLNLQTQISNLLNPTPTIRPDPMTIVKEVRSLARLETVQFSVEKIITANTGIGILDELFGDKLLFVGHGLVIAGIDFSQLKPEDIWYEGDRLHIRLPEPEVFISSLDNQKSYVYDRRTGLLTRGDTQLESLARKAAEQEILKGALEDGILEQARTNAEQFLRSFLNQLGHTNIIFEKPPADT
jgi:hypothetical protein